MGLPISEFFGPQGARKPRQYRKTTPANTEVARILDRVHIRWITAKVMPTGTPIFSLACIFLRRRLTAVAPATPSDEERGFLIHSHGLLLGGSSAVRVGLGGLAPSNTSSGLGGLTLSLPIFTILANTGPE